MGSNFASMGADVFHRCLRIIDTVNVAYTTQTYEVIIYSIHITCRLNHYLIKCSLLLHLM